MWRQVLILEQVLKIPSSTREIQHVNPEFSHVFPINNLRYQHVAQNSMSDPALITPVSCCLDALDPLSKIHSKMVAS